ncbi:Crp/Fnr family transcriptional regulator [Sandarakinorhabdus glacialis]|uniref:Crp/Fnr family transcriptional regulator n=1 Tax=Sandarakinorhabdus glacialis TaxID=1614636 RepID=UPI001FB11637|nr:Crp/Fnr family transcriptional regulator [Polymorphobacter glacialis]
MSDEELVGLAKLGVQRRLVRGDVLVRAGDPPLACANVQAGVMKIASVTAAGDEAIVGLLYSGDFIGGPFAAPAEHDVTALTDVELCMFPRAAFEASLADHQRMERLLLERTMIELARARRWLVRIGRASARARVAGFLGDMGRRLAVVNDCRRDAAAVPAASFELPLSRSEIGDLLGLTIETVSRQLTLLRAAGVIDLPGGRMIVVRDAAALAAAADETV